MPKGKLIRWTENDIKVIRDGAGIRSWKEIADEIGKSYGAVASLANSLGIKGRPRGAYYGNGFQKGKDNPAYVDGTSVEKIRVEIDGKKIYRKKYLSVDFWWTEEMDQVLRDNIEVLRFSEISKLVGRSNAAVANRARYLGLNGIIVSRKWTAEEDQFVLENNLKLSQKEIAKVLNRTWMAVGKRAENLGCVRKNLRGKNSPRFRGGREQHYGIFWHAEIRPAVLERDNYMCQHPNCSVYSPSGNGRIIHVHHIVPRPLTRDDSLSNLVTLCHPHHYSQSAHKWLDVTPDLLDSLPHYQKLILKSRNEDCDLSSNIPGAGIKIKRYENRSLEEQRTSQLSLDALWEQLDIEELVKNNG